MSRTGFAPSGSARIAYEVEGAGPPVMLVHAGVTDRRAWWPVVEALKPTHTTLTFDQRGFGDTTFTPEDHSPVDDALAVLDHAGIEEPVAVVGCSMGGRLALDLTLARPERVSQLVLIGSACRGAPGPDEWPESYREIGLALDAAEEAGDLDEVNRLEAWLWLDGPSAPEGRVTGPPRTMFLEMNRWALGADDPGDEIERPSAWDRLHDITVPTLVLIGELDLEDVRRDVRGPGRAHPRRHARGPGGHGPRTPRRAPSPLHRGHRRLPELTANEAGWVSRRSRRWPRTWPSGSRPCRWGCG